MFLQLFEFLSNLWEQKPLAYFFTNHPFVQTHYINLMNFRGMIGFYPPIIFYKIIQNGKENKFTLGIKLILRLTIGQLVQ